MKKKLLSLIIPALLLTGLTSCGNSKKYDALCAAAADSAPILLNSSTGKEIQTSETRVRELKDYNSVLALNSYTFQEKELEITWELAPKEKWVQSIYSLDETRYKITPIYGKEAYDASIKCIVSYKEGNDSGKAELNWKFHVESTETVEMTLEQINTKYVENGNQLGDLAKNEEGKDVVIGTRGIITGHFAEPDDVYAGVFIQDGDYALQLYAGSLSSLWKEGNFKVGDCVFVVGKLSIYGVIEMAPEMLESIDATAYNIKAPNTLDLSNKEWNGSLMVNQSALISLDNCVYSSGNVEKEGAHASINFKRNGTDVLAYCNYHLGKTAMLAIKDLVATYVANETTVTIKGVIGFYNGTPQIVPVFGTESFIAAK